jgi:flagellar motor switch protein FliM
MLQVTARNEVVVQLGFHLRLAEVQGMLNLCIPAAAIESVGANFARTWHGQRRDPTASDRQHLHDSLARVLVPVSVNLDTTLKARELLELAPGDVLSLGSSLQEPLDLRVGGAVKFKGRLSAAGPHTAVHVLRAVAASAREN